MRTKKGGFWLPVVLLLFLCGCEPGFFITLLVLEYQKEKKNRLRIETKSLPDGVLMEQYSVYLKARGGEKPYTWAITDGRLPQELSLTPDTGLISGLPKEVGTFAFTVTVTDAKKNTASRQFYLKITSNGQQTYILTVNSNYGEPVPGVGANEIAANTQITASCGPTPYPGPDPMSGTRYKCTGFNGSGSGLPADSDQTSYTFTITENCSITWLWDVQHRLTVEAEPVYGGRVSISVISGSGEDAPYYTQGTRLELQANPAPGFAFVRWLINGSEVADNPTQISIDYPISVTAVFRGLTIYVNGANGDDANDGYTPQTALKTIAAALQKAQNGDTIVVADGTYNEHDLDFAGKAVKLTSESGAGNCIIDCGGMGRAFHFHSGEGSDSVVEGFTITGGSVTGNGGAILCEGASPVIRFCALTENSAVSGGAVFADDSSMRLENCLIAANTASLGGGVATRNSSVGIVSCTIAANTADNYGGGLHLGNSSQLDCANTIIWLNDAGQDGGPAHITANSHAEFINCDLRVNAISGTGTHNETSCISQVPLFRDATNGDFHLRGGSPCIDAGDNSYTTWTQDLDTRKRVWDGDGDGTDTVDIGCYEGAWRTVSPLIGSTIQETIDASHTMGMLLCSRWAHTQAPATTTSTQRARRS